MNLDITVSGEKLKIVLDRLDAVRLEILRLRAMLLPEEEPTEEEKREIEEARKEMAEGHYVTLKDVAKELG